LADFCALARDPHAVDPVEIGRIPVVLTAVSGAVVHRG
jgi:predicted amidohydrolase YtcJ